jgi:endo-1,4-beta-xylanase
MDFGVGTLIQRRYWNDDPRYKQILARDFNRAVSPIFMHNTQPERGRYNLQGMDEDMKFARAHNIKLFGAALVYRNNNSPEWMNLTGGRCGGYNADQLDRIMKEHIQTLVRHGGDVYYAWEVVNEPTAPGRNGCWSQVMGQVEMITKAFKYAREGSPDALLVLNDTFGQEGLERGRVDEFFNLIHQAKAKGAPIDVAGCEMHLEAHRLRPGYLDEFKYFLDKARKEDVKVEVTEMDLYQGPVGALADAAAKQKEVFYNVTKTCLKDSNCISFYVWGVSDRLTWLKTRPNNQLSDSAPLLFDDQYNRKLAYDGVLQALKEGR